MSELVVIRAADDAALVRELERLVVYLDRAPEVSLLDFAYTCSLTKGESVIAFVAMDISSLRARLASAVSRLASGKVQRLRDKSGTYYAQNHLLGKGRGKLAFVYPGVMSFYPDMLRDLAIENETCRGAFDELEEALVGDIEFTPSSFIFPPAPYYRHDADIFCSGAYAQALVSTYAACMALTRLVAEVGLTPHGVVGFAGGDLAAMVCSGAVGETVSRADQVALVRDIYRIVHKAVNHGGMDEVAMMSVLSRRPDEISAALKDLSGCEAELVVDFSPRQKTYAIKPDAVEAFTTALSAAGLRTMRLALDRPFNTSRCERLVPAVRKFTDEWMRHASTCDVYSCATASRVSDHVRTARKEAASRWAQRVRFCETVRQMFKDGYRVFLEVGPRGLMTSAVTDTLRNTSEDHVALALNSIHRSGRLQLQHTLGQLAALGAQINIAKWFEQRGARQLDLDAPVLVEMRRNAEMLLSRSFPRMTLLSGESLLAGGATDASALAEPKGRGAKAAARAAAVAQKARRQRQFDFGALNPLVSDADILENVPNVTLEITKIFNLKDLPFVGDYALGTSQLSYADPNLKGLILLPLPVAAEIMAEVASMLVPNRTVIGLRDLSCFRMISFSNGGLHLFIRAERVAPRAAGESEVQLLLRDDSPDSAYTSPVMTASVVLADVVPPVRPVSVGAHNKPRSVHWSDRDIYPARLSCGRRLRNVRFVETWSESGIDYEVAVPAFAGNVAFTRFPMWRINPLLLQVIASGFPLWRSHERFMGAFSVPFRMRQLSLFGREPEEGAHLKCYMRLSDVTPKSQICDFSVSDGNGNELMRVSGWEELTERVPAEYCELVRQPATSFLSNAFEPTLLGEPLADFASAFITDVPYSVFERNEELWLRTLSHVVLDANERRDFSEMTGSTARRTEWLFGRVVAKEAVRRYLKQYYQARWSDADIRIWADDFGKPHALGAWNDYLAVKLDIAIAHTSRFVVAIAAANAHVGVDIESAERDLTEEFASGVFGVDELELASQAADASQATIKFWCAKEAVSKALGTGIRYSPKEMIVTDFQAETGKTTLRLEGAWAEAFKVLKGRDIQVTVRTLHGHAIASCFLPNSLFGD